jgi:hypothetical protein
MQVLQYLCRRMTAIFMLRHDFWDMLLVLKYSFRIFILWLDFGILLVTDFVSALNIS